MITNIQSVIERQRTEYDLLGKPLLQYMAEIHGLSVRKFAEVFGISNGYAHEILTHRTLPSLELAVRIARYWRASVDELFGWRIDDTGDRSPLVAEVPGVGRVVLCSERLGGFASDPMPLVEKVLEILKGGESGK